MTDALRNHTPRICAQQSITVPPEAGAKSAQSLLHESEEWHAVHDTLRNSVEGMNGFVKDGAREAADDPERRRIRGVAPQSVFMAFLLCAANLRTYCVQPTCGLIVCSQPANLLFAANLRTYCVQPTCERSRHIWSKRRRWPPARCAASFASDLQVH